MDLNNSAAGSLPVLLVRCESWREFAEHYAADIGNGGMYVVTDQPPALLTLLEVRVQLPEAIEIVLRARVVQVVDQAQASSLGKPPGIGLELLDLDAERKRQVYQLVEFARWQGATDDPNASFARTMLELSPSLPPAEVGHRLSLMPRPNGGSMPASGRPSQSSSSTRRVLDENRASDSSASHRIARDGRQRSLSPEPARTSSRATGESGTSVPAAAVPSGPPKPTDQVKLKLVLTEFAHKHYEAALRLTHEMLENNPGDPGALRWQHMCNARMAQARNDDQAAAGHYEQALQYDPDNREARDFVRTVRRDQKLNSLPFGRYFTKKK